MVYHFVYLTLTVLLATLVIYSIMECKKLDKYLNLRTQLPTLQTPDLSVTISTPKSSTPATPTYNSTKFSSSYFSSQSPHRLHHRATYWQFYQQILLLGNKTCLSIRSQQDIKDLNYLVLHKSLTCFCRNSEISYPSDVLQCDAEQHYYDYLNSATNVCEGTAQFNHGVGETSFQELQQILSQLCENVSDSVPTPSRLDPAFDCSTSDNAFPSNAIDYMVSASSPSAGSTSVPDETTPTSAPDIARPINTPDQATTTSTTYDDPSLSSHINSVEDLVSKLPTLPSYHGF